MPNITDNILVVETEDTELLKAIRDNVLIGSKESPQFTFTKIVPEPEGLADVPCDMLCLCFMRHVKNHSSETFDCPDSVKNAVPDYEERIKQHKYYYNKYGHASWYSWRIDNWGTKWDAFGTEIVIDTSNRFEVYFQTAWSPPTMFYETLVERYPEADIAAYWNDEGSYERERVI